jgi:hypothetical protein
MVLILSLCFSLLRGSAADEPRFQQVTIDGVAVTLAEVAEERGIRLEQDQSANQVVLRADTGQITPILCNAASKALFTDARLRGRKTRVVGRRHEGLPFIEVVAFQVEEADGTLKTPEYFCDVCTISVRFDQICPCCQGEMELRMKPEG